MQSGHWLISFDTIASIKSNDIEFLHAMRPMTLSSIYHMAWVCPVTIKPCSSSPSGAHIPSLDRLESILFNGNLYICKYIHTISWVTCVVLSNLFLELGQHLTLFWLLNGGLDLCLTHWNSCHLFFEMLVIIWSKSWQVLMLNGTRDRETSDFSASCFVTSITDALNRTYGDPCNRLQNLVSCWNSFTS